MPRTIGAIARKREAINRAKEEAREAFGDDLSCLTSIAAPEIDGKLLIEWLREVTGNAVGANASIPVPAFLRGAAQVNQRGPWWNVIVEGVAEGRVYRYEVSWCNGCGTIQAVPIPSE